MVRDASKEGARGGGTKPPTLEMGEQTGPNDTVPTARTSTAHVTIKAQNSRVLEQAPHEPRFDKEQQEGFHQMSVRTRQLPGKATNPSAASPFGCPTALPTLQILQPPLSHRVSSIPSSEEQYTPDRLRRRPIQLSHAPSVGSLAHISAPPAQRNAGRR